MILFRVDVVSKEQRLHLLVHAENGIAARAYLRRKFPGCDFQNMKELHAAETSHFELAPEARV